MFGGGRAGDGLDLGLDGALVEFTGNRNLIWSIELTNNPKKEMGKGWPWAFSHPNSVCSLSLSFSPSLYLLLCPFSIIHTLVTTHACSKPPDILSTNTTPSLSGCSLTILPHIPLLSPFPHPPSLSPAILGYKQRGGDKQQEQVTYLSCNQTFPSRLGIFQSTVNHI